MRDMHGEKRGRTVVIALGNPLMSDDGFGLRVLEALREAAELPADVEALDGGTWGLTLMPAVESSRRLLLIDAIDAGLEPGALVRLERDEIPGMLCMKVSPHHVDMLDVLALTRLRGTHPADIVAIGVQPGCVHLGTGLSPAVEARIDEIVRQTIDQLRVWGHRVLEQTTVPV